MPTQKRKREDEDETSPAAKKLKLCHPVYSLAQDEVFIVLNFCAPETLLAAELVSKQWQMAASRSGYIHWKRFWDALFVKDMKPLLMQNWKQAFCYKRRIKQLTMCNTPSIDIHKVMQDAKSTPFPIRNADLLHFDSPTTFVKQVRMLCSYH